MEFTNYTTKVFKSQSLRHRIPRLPPGEEYRKVAGGRVLRGSHRLLPVGAPLKKPELSRGCKAACVKASGLDDTIVQNPGPRTVSTLFPQRLHEPIHSACGACDEQEQNLVRNTCAQHPARSRPKRAVLIISQYQQNNTYDENDHVYNFHCSPFHSPARRKLTKCIADGDGSQENHGKGDRVS